MLDRLKRSDLVRARACFRAFPACLAKGSGKQPERERAIRRVSEWQREEEEREVSAPTLCASSP